MSTLTNNARERLTAAGWTEGRRISTDALENDNHESGFFVSEKATSFLREFGYLRLTYPHFRVPEHVDWCHFDASLAAGNAVPETIADYEEAIGSRLTVIGEARSDHMVLCMDEEGRVFGGFEDVLVKFGDSGIDAINCLCDGGEGEVIALGSAEVASAKEGIELSEAARRALLAAGWTDRGSERRIAGKPAAFLDEFGGVSFACQNKRSGADVCRIGRVDVPEGYVLECSEELHRKLVPVGLLQDSTVVLLMDEGGRVFGGMKETSSILWQFGLSGTDAINNLVVGKIAKRVV